MIIIPLLLTMGLDMSLPEFQPITDVSGNYIVGSYDVSSDEFSVDIIEDNPVSGNDFAVADSLSIAPANVETLSVSDNNDIVSAIEQLNIDNNQYWEMFLDSYPVEVSHHLRSSYKAPLSWRFTSAGLIDYTSATNGRIAYIPVQIGITYTISDVTSGSGFTQNYRVGVVDDIDNPTQVTNFVSNSSLFNGVTITPSMNGYLVFFMFNYTHEIGFTSDWNTIEQDSYTLSELGNAVVTIRDEFNIKLRAVLFVTLINFLYPIAMAIKSNIIGGDK